MFFKKLQFQRKEIKNCIKYCVLLKKQEFDMQKDIFETKIC
jgi:hypothetical protein